MAHNDRIIVSFTSDVPDAARRAICDAIASTAQNEPDVTLYVYSGPDTTTNDTLRYDIAGHDRDTFDLTPGQVVERLRESAKAQGMTVAELLRRLATQED